ncbi:MAG: 7,8-dihydro-6-hydroxymethylpterin dimethyltransferase [Thermoproteota archaeon]|nr:7,8-dihydro-6-hydroxymethylpterin dimethyltransferase [Thermoproteota archaeon]
MKVLKTTKSICPECFKVIEATIFEDDGKVYIKKECKDHGFYEDVYWSDSEDYKRVQKYSIVGDGVENPNTKKIHDHPFDCGLCPNHKSQTILAIIDVTNRCNLRCPICFANAAVAGYVYEPTKEQIDNMLKNLKNIKPAPADALQFSGGEPTIREDLPELVRMAKDIGFNHIEVNSNGIKLAESVDYCKQLLDAGVSTIYLQFDAVTSEPYLLTRGQDLLKTKLQAIENCRKAGLDSIVLVPTIVKGVNDDQLGAIISFAVENFDVVRCVNFQPVSITGRIDYEKRKEMRITIPDCLKLLEKQTLGQVKSSDFYPVPVVVPVSRAVGALKGKRYLEFTVHEHCGMATFTFVKDKKLIPITEYADVEKFMDSMKSVYEAASKGSKRKAQLQLLSSSLRYTKFSLLKQLMSGVFAEGSYGALGNLMKNVLMISMMHFQDPYNFDLERLERCGIHYAVPDGRIIPFCAMNTIYRQSVEKELGVPLKEWQQRKKLEKEKV